MLVTVPGKTASASANSPVETDAVPLCIEICKMALR